ncbi:hypothetical protein ACTQ45_04195 [Fundicoccus sp. Sow4_D5]|uniref:hypothetical protein n=1 Tax=unclassified Fundicoccus TaxID=2761543 RepID=UPI003F91A77D
MRNKQAGEIYKERDRYVLVLCLLLMTFLAGGRDANAQTEVKGLSYAPNVFYQVYDYLGDGNEYASQVVNLQYPPNDQGIYQFSVSTAGTSIVFVYQLSKEGVYELAYYPENYEDTDLRNHADATDSQKSLVFPATLSVGTEFKRGYRKEETYRVVDLLATFELEGATYYNVIVVEPVNHPEGGEQRFYYAPNIGHIMDEFIFTENDDDYPVTTSLDTLKGPTYVWPTDFE